jgi:predicted nucleotidyltransferase component of viral defense system
MLSLNQIKAYYPESLQGFESFMLREYLQFKILEIIFDSPYADKLSFLGGTCLRIVHGNTRFSEDIDFDNFNLQIEDFNTITDIVKRKLELTGYEVEIRNVHKGAYHCYIRFPKLLFNEGLNGNKEEKILIQLDTEPHHFKYTPEKPILNKFDVFTQINSTPKDILLSQKFYAVINRKRNKGRDFFDIVFLLGLGQKPNYDYLHDKVGIKNLIELKSKILDKCAQLDMNEMANDVSPFLFQSNDVKKVLLFAQYIQQIEM